MAFSLDIDQLEVIARPVGDDGSGRYVVPGCLVRFPLEELRTLERHHKRVFWNSTLWSTALVVGYLERPGLYIAIITVAMVSGPTGWLGVNVERPAENPTWLCRSVPERGMVGQCPIPTYCPANS